MRCLQWRWLLAVGVLILSACGGGGGEAGPTGPSGSTGTSGPAGPQGPAGSSNPVIRVAGNGTPSTDAASARWAALAPKVEVISVTMGGAPVVKFSVADADGTPIVGLGNRSQSATATVSGLTNLSFAMAKLVPGTNGAPSKWVSYIVTTVPTKNATSGAITPATATRPSTDNTGTLVDHGDGSYTYTFYRDISQIKAQVDGFTFTGANVKADLGDLSYEPGLVHRLAIQLSGNAPGTGTNTPNAVEVPGYTAVPLVNPVDLIHDFVPATGAKAESGREIVATAKCNECHRKLGGIPGDSAESSGAGFHGGNRNEVRFCVVCHNDQRKFGRSEATLNAATLAFTSTTERVDGRAVGNLPNHIHKIHMGKLLSKQNYNYGGVVYNETLFPQDIRNCTKCHDGSESSTARTAQGNNWKNVPNRLACGACHDGINFATGAGVTLRDAARGLKSTTRYNGLAHGGLAQADDSQCATCHKPDAVDVSHLPVTPPSANSALHVQGGNANTNAAWIASNTSRLPAGAIKVSYDIKSVSRNAARQPVLVFRMLQNGSRKDLNVFASTTPSPATGARELWDNFMGAPSVYFVFSVPQDGIAAPADFNASASGYLKALWAGTATGSGAGTLSGPDADGYYTATLTGVKVPDNAVMLTGGLGYSYSLTSTMPLTQTNVEGYPVSPSPLAGQALRTGGLIVIAPNAQKVATGYTGRRPIVEDARCNKCHQELGTFTEEAFHGGQRNDGSTCSWCHTPNRASSGWSADSTSYIHSIHAGNKRSVPFTWHAASTSESFADVKFPGVLKECETCHLPNTYNFAAATSQSALANRLYRTTATGKFNKTASADPIAAFAISPYVVADNLADYGLGFSFNAATQATVPAAGTTLVNSPIATACFACHDNAQAVAHMRTNGGSIYAPRSTALGTLETCMVCHDSGRIADIKVMHAK